MSAKAHMPLAIKNPKYRADRFIFGVSHHKHTNTEDGPAIELYGTSDRTQWTNPTYTSFVTFIGRMYIDTDPRNLIGATGCSATQDQMIHFIEWNNEQYVVAMTGYVNQRSAIKRSKQLGKPLISMVIIPYKTPTILTGAKNGTTA
jgi:hypothetical protein